MQNFPQSALIVEPNEKLTHPYNLISQHYHSTRVSSLTEAIQYLDTFLPKVLFLSTSLKSEQMLKILEKLRQNTHTHLPKIIFVLDFSQTMSKLPKISWDGQADIISTQTPPAAVEAVIGKK